MKINFKDITCLIVDDDLEFANSIYMFIEDIGIKSVIIPKSIEAIDYIKKNKVNLLILDLMMPKLNGIEIINEIRKDNKYLPIIVISGTGKIEEAIEAVKKGADDFISKPISNFDQLEISITKVLEKMDLIEENDEYKKNLELMIKLRTAQIELKNHDLEILNKNLEDEIIKRKDAEAEVKKGTLNIITAIEDERKRLSKELHDSIGQRLMFSKLSLELAAKEITARSDKLDLAIENLNQIGTEIYSLIRSLYPPSIEKYPLTKNIETLINNFEKTKSIRIDFSISGEEKKLDNEVKLNLYRLYQEALNNITKHSSAEEITVLLDFAPQKISGMIENDGVLDDKKNRKFGSGIGIFTMGERINKLNGKFFIDDRTTNKFKISFEVPI